MLNIVLFGPPGAGKGTQSQKLIDKYDLVHLSTGDMLRSEIAAGSPIGMEAKSLMDKGILVPDEVVISMISARLDKFSYANGFIFDGFPRTVAQAEALDRLLSSKGTSVAMMLELTVDNEELTRRIIQRGKDSGRTDDQDESIVRSRINEYNDKTAPLKNYYSAQGKYYAVNGIGNIDEILTSLCRVIESNYKTERHKEPVPKETSAAAIRLTRKQAAKKTTKKGKGKAKKSSAKKKAAKKKPLGKKSAKKTTKNPARKVVIRKKTAGKISRKNRNKTGKKSASRKGKASRRKTVRSSGKKSRR